LAKEVDENKEEDHEMTVENELKDKEFLKMNDEAAVKFDGIRPDRLNSEISIDESAEALPLVPSLK